MDVYFTYNKLLPKNKHQKNFITRAFKFSYHFLLGYKKQFQIRFTQHIFSDNYKEEFECIFDKKQYLLIQRYILIFRQN
jgi:hypothetical protein